MTRTQDWKDGIGGQVKSVLGSGPISLKGIEEIGLGNPLGSLDFWGYMRLPMTNGKEPKPKKRRRQELV